MDRELHADACGLEHLHANSFISAYSAALDPAIGNRTAIIDGHITA
jgi:hypothetical protein